MSNTLNLINYAIAHLDKYQGYDDIISINNLIESINNIAISSELSNKVDVEEIKQWGQFLEDVKNNKDSTNSITVAIAYALKYIIKNYCID